MNYKAEIDGLRALSILAVILFHINQDIFSGGFIGVDIFFLISGYLITKIIIADYSKKRFSLLNFYQRRIRRILPALFFMVVIVYLFNIFFLENNYLKQFQTTLKPTIFFYSNFYFWLEHSDYFSPLHNIQLLIHTWSLSIEEQFYILYPLLFIFLFKKYKKVFFNIIIFIFVLSLIFSHLPGSFSNNFPFIDFKNFNLKIDKNGFLFFITPARVWELLLGAILVRVETFDIIKKKIPQSILLLLLILIIIFFILGSNINTPSPSVITLIPLLCVAIIILYFDKTKSSLVKLILTNSISIKIGLISYSLYLWHNPILNFLYHFLIEPTYLHLAVTIILIFIVSYLSWKFIEKPFRKSSLSFSKVLFFLIIILILIKIISLYVENFKTRDVYFDTIKIDNKLIISNEKYEKQNNEKKIQLSKLIEKNEIDRKFKTSGKKILLFGDSHATDSFLSLKIYEKKEAGIEFQFFTTDGLITHSDYRTGNLIPNFKNDLDNSQLVSQADYIMIAPNWNSFDLNFLPNLIDYFLNRNKKIIIVNQNPRLVSLRQAKYIQIKHKFKTIEEGYYKLLNPEFFLINKRLKQIAKNKNVYYIDRFSWICNQNEKKCSILTKNNELMHLDGGHFTHEGIKDISEIVYEKKVFEFLKLNRY